MAIIVGSVHQKGGTSKSTLSRLVAREMAAIGWSVLICDMDRAQGTSVNWRKRREANEVTPEVAAETFTDVTQALKKQDDYDLLVFDGAPHATVTTRQIAEISNLILLPTGLSVDDLEPGVKLANELVNVIERKRIAFVLCRVGVSELEIQEARDYLEEAKYKVLKHSIPERTAYRRASDEGKAISETMFESLNAYATDVAQEIVNELEKLQ